MRPEEVETLLRRFTVEGPKRKSSVLPRMAAVAAALLLFAGVFWAVVTPEKSGGGTPVQDRDIEKWIEELGDQDPDVRDRADRALRNELERAETAIRRVLSQDPEAEVRNRLEKMLLVLDSRKGGVIACVLSGNRIGLFTPEGKKLRVLEPLKGRKGKMLLHSLSWSPDGRWLAYCVQRENPAGRSFDWWLPADVHLWDSKTEKSEIIKARLKHDSGFVLHWSADGRRLAYTNDKWQAHVAEWKDGSWKGKNLDVFAVPRGWTRDGKRVYLEYISGSRSLAEQDPVTEGERVLMEDEGRAFCVSPDDKRFYYFPKSGRGTLLSRVRGKADETTIHRGLTLWAGVAPRLSPDGRWLTVPQQTESSPEQIMLIDSRKVEKPVRIAGKSPSWSADGGRLVYSRLKILTGKYGLVIRNLKTGKEIRWKSEESMSHPAWRP